MEDTSRDAKHARPVNTGESSRLPPPGDTAWSKALGNASEWGSVELRDVALTDAHVKQLLLAAPKDAHDRFKLLLRCYGVRFPDRIWFGNTHVFLQLFGCVFEDESDLAGVFENTVLDGVTFKRAAQFANSQFVGETQFRNVRFEGGAGFYMAQFHGDVRFRGVSFRRRSHFQRSVFEGDAEFGPLLGDRFESRPAEDVDSDTTFVLQQVGDIVPTTLDSIDFGGAEFKGDTFFEISVAEEAKFRDTRFSQTFGSITAEQSAFDGARFAGDTRLNIRGGQISLTGARFEALSTIRFSGALVADGASFAAETTLAGPPPGRSQAGRILSLRASSLSKLKLADVDLSSCLFAGAYHVDEVSVEPSCTFATPPPSPWFARRRTIAEENLWRDGRRRLGGVARQWQVPSFDSWLLQRVPPPAVLNPSEISSLYRALRKATEERKDEPGAADFYYGEMEMRRHAAPSAIGERLLLSLFWAVSGYALRATRALVALAVLCVVFAFAFWSYGFEETHSFGDMLIYSLGASARIRTGFEDVPLTTAGEVLHIILGVVGPILYGLALLSLRGRVKR